ncbi:aspartate aminotransferase family protein [Cuneatibacter caecimuris]|uniref:Acetylornithine aminotransferase n=1 Tax=Cuneatibacter caecimuris TaxID=1796618 RepID=A0A4Q7PNC5_9FIRM|nr:aspartate aminotransferase family protein [Cuneatibacter caecimuris]RZT02374.1 acetylornithine/N-succinyldiaminopimelate aminotransferase [Cuneatibacter caecimuris]
MKKTEIIEKAEANLLHTYNRFPVVLDRGEGVYLYDCDGKQYLDFAAGIAVFALGYHNPDFDNAVKAQADKLVHTSNLFYNEPAAETAEKLNRLTGMDRVFFTNSGTEAIEGAIKLARKYAYNKDGCTDHEIIAMNHSFHGRSMGALSVTGKAAYQDPFKPLIGGVKFAEYNDLDSVKDLVTDKTCAVILETFQGEGGIYPAEEGFLKGLRRICDEKDILLIFDEIQCGMGRTGKMFCYQHYGVEPDVLTVAKALGNGLPVGAFLCKEFAAALVPGDHGTTYGGNPLVCAAAGKVLDLFEERKLPEHAKEVGEYLYQQLEGLKERHSCIKDHRGMGLLQGLEFVESTPVGEVCSKAQDQGLIVISASGNVLRFVPPLIVEKEHVDEMIRKLENCLD